MYNFFIGYIFSFRDLTKKKFWVPLKNAEILTVFGVHFRNYMSSKNWGVEKVLLISCF